MKGSSKSARAICNRALLSAGRCLRWTEGPVGGALEFAHIPPTVAWRPILRDTPYQVLVFFNAPGADYGSIEGGRARPGI